ncbi:MAG: cupin domain-containing protein [Bacteroidota bacterium]
MKKSILTSEGYIWGDNCSAWVLVDSETLTVKQEQMPPGTSEKIHFHTASQQFFFVLKGKATLQVAQKTIELVPNEGFLVLPGIKHQIKNTASEELNFLVISEPSTFEDRIEEPF